MDDLMKHFENNLVLRFEERFKEALEYMSAFSTEKQWMRMETRILSGEVVFVIWCCGTDAQGRTAEGSIQYPWGQVLFSDDNVLLQAAKKMERDLRRMMTQPLPLIDPGGQGAQTSH